MYGGTQSEMQRLIKDAAALDSSIDANSMSFANIVKAINAVQTEMGITGTTAFEAGRTISGSVGSMKSAWTNLVTGFADGSADIGGLIDNLVATIVGDGTENNLGVIGNVLPAIETALGGIVQLIAGAAPKIIEILPGLVDRTVPTLISAATSLVDSVIDVLPGLLETVVKALNDNLPILSEAAISILQSLIDGISENQEMLMSTAMETITYLATSLISMLPQIVQLGLDLIVSLAMGIAGSLPELIPTIVDVILKIVEILTNPESLSMLLDAALEIILGLAWGLVDSIPRLVDAVFNVVSGIIDFLIDPKNLGMLIAAAIELVVAIGTGLVNAIPELVRSVLELVFSIGDTILNTDWLKVGKDIVGRIWDGLKTAWKSVTSWFTDAWNGIKDLFSFGKGNKVDVDANLDVSSSDVVGNAVTSGFGGVVVNQNIYSKSMSPAELASEVQYQQQRAVLYGY